MQNNARKPGAILILPWYYTDHKNPNENLESENLERVVLAAREYKGKRFRNRYLLQAERALFTLNRYDECINFWTECKNTLEKDIIYYLTLGYVARAYYIIGDSQTALELYAQADDIEGVFNCLRTTSEKDSALYIIYSINPESKYLREEIEKEIIAEGGKWELDELQKLCLQIANEGRVSDVDLWFYNAAIIDNLKGDNVRAVKNLKRALNSRGSEFIKESAMVLKIYIEALAPYSSTYESKMLAGVKWLEHKIIEHKEEAEDMMLNEGIYSILSNYSCFYWNDMLRKIVLSEVCPKLIKAHKEENAVAFANMADNFIFNFVGVDGGDEYADVADYRKKCEWNEMDYCNTLYNLINDTLSVEALIRYVRTLEHPKTHLQSYLNDRGYSDKYYFYEIIGTRLIREMRYKEAAEWLRRVPASFQNQLNTYREGYFCRDPFAIERKYNRNNTQDYKYSFALKMATLEEQMLKCRDSDRRALMMVKYAIGLKSSFSICWALSFYRHDRRDYDPSYGPTSYSKARQQGLNRAEKMFEEALTLCKDEEIKARINIIFGNAKTVVENYPSTIAAEYVRSSCDKYIDYHFEQCSVN